MTEPAPPEPTPPEPPASDRGGDPGELLAGELRIAVTRLTRRLRAERGERSLTLSQLSALSSLEHHGPCSPTALADLEGVQPPSITRLIAALEELELAERAPHERDKRQAVIAVTPKGRAVLEESRTRRNAWLARALAGLTAKERAKLAAALPLLERLGKS